MRFAVTLILPAMLAAMPAGAQGVFNMGGLTQTLTIPTDQPEARRARDSGAFRSVFRATRAAHPGVAPRVNRSAMNFSRDPAITSRIQQRMLARIQPLSVRAELAKVYAGDFTSEIAGAIRPVGMQYNNVADALAVYLVTAWQATHRSYVDKPAQFQAVARQMAVAGSRVGLDKASNATKQELAETALYEAIMIGSAFKAAKTDAKLAARLAKVSSAGTRNMFGYDVAALQMTTAGLAQ